MRALSFVLVALAVPTTLSAQSLVGHDGVTGNMITFSGTPGACGYPAGPIQNSVAPVDTFMCTMPLPPGAPGGTTVGCMILQANGNYNVAGGTFIARFNAAGNYTGSSDIGAWGFGPITGGTVERGLPSGGDKIWYTDGTNVARFSQAITCSGIPSLQFAINFADYTGPGILTGLSFDHSDDTVWACTSVGRVVHFDKSGNELSSFIQTQPSLTGIAVDASTGTLFVTDGSVVVAYDATGAPRTHYWWPNAAELSPAGLVGLDWIPAALDYGAGGHVSSGTVPTLSTSDWSYLGNAGYSVDATGDGGASYQLFASFNGDLCPAIPILGLNALIAPPVFDFGLALADGAGTANFPLPLPLDITLTGVVVNLQALAFPPSGLATTQGLALSLAWY